MQDRLQIRPVIECLGYWGVSGMIGAIAILSRSRFPGEVAEFLGGHQFRAIFEHASEAAIVPLAVAGLVWLSYIGYDWNLQRVRFIRNVFWAAVIPVYLAAQCRIELDQAAFMFRGVQTDQLVGTLAGVCLGVGTSLLIDKVGQRLLKD